MLLAGRRQSKESESHAVAPDDEHSVAIKSEPSTNDRPHPPRSRRNGANRRSGGTEVPI
jgi:hypothetical protein